MIKSAYILELLVIARSSTVREAPALECHLHAQCHFSLTLILHVLGPGVMSLPREPPCLQSWLPRHGPDTWHSYLHLVLTCTGFSLEILTKRNGGGGELRGRKAALQMGAMLSHVPEEQEESSC